MAAGERCTHFEDKVQPEACEECVCGDCGAWVGSTEIARNGGVCGKCLDAALDGFD